jgi:hypothetical protein
MSEFSLKTDPTYLASVPKEEEFKNSDTKNVQL